MKQGKNNEINSGDFYIIEGIKVSSDDLNLIFDYTSNEYKLANKKPRGYYIKGIVEILKNGRLKRGYFVFNRFVNIQLVLINGNIERTLNYEVVQNNYNYRENLSDGYFYHYKSIKALDFKKQRKIQRDEKNRLPYNLDKGYQKQFEEVYNNNKLEIKKRTKVIAKLIKKYSFGFEFETINGFIPERLSGKVGLVPLRDGSIAGIEYATIPLSGEKGIEALKESVELLNKRTEYNDSCSLHLHIGGVPRTKKFLLGLYLVSLFIQEDVFRHFPITKMFNWGIKNKNYTKKYNAYDVIVGLDKKININNITKNFDILLAKLAETSQLNGLPLSKITGHPNDPNGLHKWQIKSRYHWINLIPIIFGNKKTIEFRIHTPTTNINKILSYLILCVAIVEFTTKNLDTILGNTFALGKNNLSVQEILSYLPRDKESNIRRYVTDYFNNRKYYSSAQNREGNVNGNESEIYCFNIIEDSFPLGRKIYDKLVIKNKFYKKNEKEDLIEEDVNNYIPHKFKKSPYSTGIKRGRKLNNWELASAKAMKIGHSNTIYTDSIVGNKPTSLNYINSAPTPINEAYPGFFDGLVPLDKKKEDKKIEEVIDNIEKRKAFNNGLEKNLGNYGKICSDNLKEDNLNLANKINEEILELKCNGNIIKNFNYTGNINHVKNMLDMEKKLFEESIEIQKNSFKI